MNKLYARKDGVGEPVCSVKKDIILPLEEAIGNTVAANGMDVENPGLIFHLINALSALEQHCSSAGEGRPDSVTLEGLRQTITLANKECTNFEKCLMALLRDGQPCVFYFDKEDEDSYWHGPNDHWRTINICDTRVSLSNLYARAHMYPGFKWITPAPPHDILELVLTPFELLDWYKEKVRKAGRLYLRLEAPFIAKMLSFICRSHFVLGTPDICELLSVHICRARIFQ